MGLTANENFQYEVSDRLVRLVQLRELQKSINRTMAFVDGGTVEKPKALTPKEILAELENKAASKKHSENYEHRKKLGLVIRRRKVFVYSQADQFLASDEGSYWKREKRSLTKYNSNSKMFEYTVLRNS